MVLAKHARKDIDDFCLTKTVLLRSFSRKNRDLAYGTEDRTKDFEEYQVKAQITLHDHGSKMVKEGLMSTGDATALFRYQYDKDAADNVLNPPLVVKVNDEFEIFGIAYMIRTCTPATSEDNAVIGWDVTAKQQDPA